MEQVLRKRAKTTFRIREEIQNSKESISSLARKYSISRPTVYKWKKTKRIADAKSGPKTIRSALSELEQKIVCEFRRNAKLSLDDCYISLKEQIPDLTRSNLHRCLKRNNLNLLPLEEKGKKEKKKFKTYPIGYVHIDTTDIILKKEKYSLFVAIERNTKFAYVKLCKSKTMSNSSLFLEEAVKEFPFKIHTALTDNGIEYSFNLFQKPIRKIHKFDMTCNSNNIRHKTTQFKHPWTNGQVEIMNRYLKNDTVKTYEYNSFEELSNHLRDYLNGYNFAKKLKTLKFLTPYQKIIEYYKKDKNLFKKKLVKKLVGHYI